MRKRPFILVTTFLLLSNVLSWAAIGSWRSHFAYHNATQCAVVNDKVYVVSSGSLYSYTPEDGFVACYDKSNILSDQGIRHIGVCDKSNTLVIVYENANIDLIRSDGEVVNITDFVNEISLDPQINDLRIMNGMAYLATNFGVSILDVEREEFGNTYTLDKVTYSSIGLNDFIYVATEKGLYRGDIHTNLLDAANWIFLDKEVYANLEVFEKSLIALKAKGSAYIINLTDSSPEFFCKGPINFIHRADGRLIVGNQTNVSVYTTPTTWEEHDFDTPVTYLTVAGDTYWSCNESSGLNGYQYNRKNKKVEQIATSIMPNSPIRNHCQYLNFVTDDRMLVAGGCLNYYDVTFFDGTLMMYENGTWTSFQEEGIAEQTGVYYKNMTSIVQDPKDKNHHYASSFGQGLYEFRNMQLVAHYNHKNSILETVSSKPDKLTSIRVSCLKYDEDGNLWITNADGAKRVKSPLKLLKPNGEMISLYYEELEGLPTVTEVLFDHNGWVWVVSMQNEIRLFCIDMNGTLENTEDDRVRIFREHFADQDGGAIEVYAINDIAEDRNGDIWVLTDKGPYVLYNTETVFNEDYRFTKIKVPRNDGTNYADYLLDGTYTTCMEIDAANRKWIGTLNNGLYLIGADGLETIHHFTNDNSPLPSNVIESLALHHKSGELFIGTDKGLVSYMSDATRAEETYNKETVYAYPNPVMPDYDGLITIVGLKTNSHVKVINTAGRLVAEGTSLGGSFIWDGRTPQGQRVSTGVYYVLGSDEEGNEGIVTKVLFVK